MPSFRLFIAFLFSCCILSTAALAQVSEPDGKAPVTHEQLPALIKKILVQDPTILMEAVEKMQSDNQEEMMKKAKEEIIKRKDDLYSDPTSPVVGSANADVTIIEFFDYHCVFCKQALATVNTILEKDKKVRIVFKEYPILSEDSKLVSRAAMAVNRIAKDKYFDFHKAMFAMSDNINEKLIFEEAKKLGINAEKLKTEMYGSEVEAILAKNKELGAAIGAQGTPAFIIGENLYPGAIPYDRMQKAVDDLRNEKKKASEPAKP